MSFLARAMHRDAGFGTVETCKRADLIVVEGGRGLIPVSHPNSSSLMS